MQLYDWQKTALEKDNDYALWCAEAGTGKTFGAKLWKDQNSEDWTRNRNPVVFCPKAIRTDWSKAVDHVFTPHEVRTKDLPANPSCIIIDEIDEYASPLFVGKKRSKMAEKLYNYIKRWPEAHVLGLSATPIRSTPWNLHSILCYIHRYIDWKDYRNRFFFLDTPRYMTRPAWFPKVGWQKSMQPLLDKHAEFALMTDILPSDKIPEETHTIITLKDPKYEKNEEWEASKQLAEDHRLEQLGKHLEIKKLSKGYRKVVVVAHFREQIADLEKNLGSERQTFVLHGGIADHESVIAAAEDATECYLIIQASIGAGFELPSFTAMVFASQGYSVRNYVQMIGRIKRSGDLLKTKGRKVLRYYYIQSGKMDRGVYKSIEAGKDFVPSQYKN